MGRNPVPIDADAVRDAAAQGSAKDAATYRELARRARRLRNEACVGILAGAALVLTTGGVGAYLGWGIVAAGSLLAAAAQHRLVLTLHRAEEADTAAHFIRSIDVTEVEQLAHELTGTNKDLAVLTNWASRMAPAAANTHRVR